jgi:DUF4097 and DUF4098 domain-containing protein YvlB
MIDESEIQDVPFDPGALEGIARVRIDCEDVELVFESHSGLTDSVQLVVQGGNNAPSLVREEDELVLVQRGRHRSGGRPATLLLPESGCPPITGRHEKGDLQLDRVNTPVTLRHGSGDVRIAGGAGAVELEHGKGDVSLGDQSGVLTVKSGAGDVRASRCRGPISISLGKGDVSVEGGEQDVALKVGAGDVQTVDCQGALAVQVGAGDITVTRPRGSSLAVKTGSGDVAVKSGSLTAMAIQVGRGDITSSAQLLLPPRRERTEQDDANAPDTQSTEPDDDNPVARILRAKGIEFLADDKGVRISSPSFQLEASDAGVRISKGGLAFEAGEHGVRLVTGGSGRASGTFDATTGGGDITVDVPAGAPIRVEALVNGGDVRSDVPLVSVGRPGPRGSTQRFVGVSDPQAEERINLRLKADRGDIRIRSVAGMRVQPSFTAPTPPTPPTPPAPPTQVHVGVVHSSPDAPTARITAAPTRDQQLRAILDALSRGEISVNEADRRIAALESGQ